MTGLSVMMWLSFAMIVIMVVAFALERWSIEMVSIATLVAWMVLFWLGPMLLGIESPLTPDDLLSGFSNQALITVLAMLVVGQGLFQTDALERPTAWLAAYGGRTGSGAVILILAVAMLTSAFVNDTPVVVMFIPIISGIAASRGIPISRVLMPLSFAALLGGKTTLIGTSTNLLAAGVAERIGAPVIGFFDFTIPAAIMAVFGFAYVVVILPRILPARTGMAQQMSSSGSGKQFIAQIEVTYGHPLAGMEAVSGMFPGLRDMTVRLVQRGETAFLPPFENLTLRPGDTVIVAATRTALTRAISEGSAAPAPDNADPTSDGNLRPADVTLAEAVVAPGSRLIGRTIEQAAVYLHTGTVVLGVERRSRMPRMRLSEIRLEAGDVLLVGGSREAVEGLRPSRDLLLLEWSAAELPTRQYARRALFIFCAMVLYAASGIGPIVIGALGAAFAMVAAGCLNIRQGLRAFDHRIFLMVGASLAAAAALESTGGAIFIAQSALSAVEAYPISVTLSVLFLLVAVLTNFLSNNATAVLFTPIAYELAIKTGNDPVPFVVAVILAASCAFATPIGYQTNLLVMGPGHYRFRDYMVGGMPLVFLMWLVYSAVGPWYYGLW